MSNAMHVAKTGLNAQNKRMQVISNNLANVNTTGFKRDRANFESLLYQVLKTSGAQTTGETRNLSGFNVGTGVKIINTDKLFTQGNIITTDNAFSINRLGLSDSFESGKSLTLGLDYRKENKDDIDQYLEVKFATILRDTPEYKIPTSSSAQGKMSNLFGSIENQLSKVEKV